MFHIKSLFGTDNKNPMDVIEEINKTKNKKKRWDDALDEKQKVSKQIEEELNKLNETYYKHTQQETYIKLADLIKHYGDEAVNKVMKDLVHISKIRDDNKWIQSRIPCWICSVN